MMPQALDLKYFLCVCESKNISRAAERLGISQPSLSLAIKRLEALSGVDLLVRSKTGVDLTREGVAFRDRSKELLALWQSISADVKKKSNKISGRFTLGAHVSVAMASLTSVIKCLMARYPELELTITHGWSRIITDQVIGFDIDFAVVVNPCPHPDLVISELFFDEVSFMIHPKNGDRSTLIYDPNLLQTQSLLKTMKAGGRRFDRVITSSSLEFIAKLTAQGVGVGIIPKRVINHLQITDLIAIQEYPCFRDRHCLIYRHDAQRTKASRTLASELKQLLIAGIEAE